jgi:hypothetical protein
MRLLAIACVAIPVAVIAPAVAYMILPPAEEDGIEAVIKKAGFEPVQPPNRLRGPGALYEVEDGYYRKVCDAGPDILRGKSLKSPIEDQTRERLAKARFKVSSEIVENSNAKLGSSRVTSIEYRLTDAAITEITLADLAEIQDQLLSQKSCDKTVQMLLHADKKVCAGYAALSATTSYKVHTDRSFDSKGESRVSVTSAVKEAIELHTDGQVRVTDRNELAGEDLFYGIQLSSLCITLDTATEPSVVNEPNVPQPTIPRTSSFNDGFRGF